MFLRYTARPYSGPKILQGFGLTYSDKRVSHDILY